MYLQVLARQFNCLPRSHFQISVVFDDLFLVKIDTMLIKKMIDFLEKFLKSNRLISETIVFLDSASIMDWSQILPLLSTYFLRARWLPICSWYIEFYGKEWIFAKKSLDMIITVHWQQRKWILQQKPIVTRSLQIISKFIHP